jgi:hypothetical protein
MGRTAIASFGDEAGCDAPRDGKVAAAPMDKASVARMEQ